jgi:hypothetical protein
MKRIKEIDVLADNHSVYSYKGYDVYQTRDEYGNLRQQLLIMKDNNLIRPVDDIPINETINCVHWIEKIIDRMNEG